MTVHMRKTKVGDLEEEVAGYMPSSFVLMYYELVSSGLKGLTDSVESARRGGGATNGAPPGSEGAVLLSEASLARKRVIDRKLRELARADLSGAKKERPRCVSCGHFGNERWKYCAACGAVWTKEGEGVGPAGGKLRKTPLPREGLNGVPVPGTPVEGGGQRWVQLR